MRNMAEEMDQNPEAEENAFATLEKRFQEVLHELLGDKNLEKYRVEYEKLAKALKKSHESENRLMTKCRELSAEIVSNRVKVDAARKLSEEDKSVADTLKKEVEKAWKMVDAAHDKELTMKETIQNLKHDISNLNKLIEQGAGVASGQEHSLKDLLKIKSDLTKERDELLTEVANIRDSLTKAIASQQETEATKAQAAETILQLQQDIQVRQNECSRETRRRERLEKEARQLQADLEARQAEVKVLSAQGLRSREELQRLEQQLREQKILNERAAKELEQLQVRNGKLQQENEQNAQSVEQLALENQQRTADLKMKEDELNQMRQEVSKLTKTREATQRRLRQAEDQKGEAEQQRDTVKNQIAGLEREMESCKKQMEMDKKAMEELVRERDLLNKNLIKATSATERQVNEVKLHEQSKKHLEHEIVNYRDEAQKQRKIIYQLEKERDRYINEASDLTQKVLQHMEDIKVREMEIFDYRKKIAEAETKLKQQQNLYEAVRSDRNLYSKNLNEALVEIAEMKRQLKIMNHQVDQLKEEIGGKESALVKEHLEFQRVEKDKEALKTELQKMKQQVQETKQFIANQEAEERKLLKIIDDADAERLRQKKQLDQVISERDVLGTQLVHRNEQLALLYEKIKIQQSMLNKGELQYSQRVEDIRLLKLEIKKLRREKGILTKTVANVEDLRCEVFHMQKELLRERTRCQALEEELENPMNVHRWRKLEACDPSTFQLIQKIHSLQKRLITKSEEVVEKELLLQEKERLYVELKHILARQPGPEVAEQLQVYQHALREKTKQLKALSSELSMCESQTQECRSQMERLDHELQNVKKKYLAQKRREQHSREKDRSVAQMGQPLIQPQRTDGPRFTGGGFSLKQPGRIAA
ncbi:cilia- and flagella-associated protein 58 isoform X1 [Anguilla anguilla]|uniref:cilia- and flagella-associated protein 58 isoform X1 n=2 Tax=Anguilla anguilla TaxID=7936 RepID=UPI0015AC85B3|nr:cilia- and flagella-associated protein 58 isoform X1 [Anguilla anguilla]